MKKLHCGDCATPTLIERCIPEYKSEIEYNGRLYEVTVKNQYCYTCTKCNEIYFDAQHKAIANSFDQLRFNLGLMFPSEIRKHRRRSGYTQKQLADALGIAKETICRWEKGHMIQSIAYDKLLRLFFKYPNDTIWVKASIYDTN